jgi:hypothetical protein
MQSIRARHQTLERKVKNGFVYVVTSSFLLLVLMSAASCHSSSSQNEGESLKRMDHHRHSIKQKFRSFIEGIQDEGKYINHEIFTSFLPDSVRAGIPKNTILKAEFKVFVSNRVILKIYANGKTEGKIIVCCFSESGKLMDYIMIQRYGHSTANKVGTAKEMMVTKDKGGFEFEIIETENPNPNAMPLFKDNQHYRREKWMLNESGKFERVESCESGPPF